MPNNPTIPPESPLPIPTGWRRLLWPLLSRKIQVAVATAVVAYLAQYNFNVSQDIVITILAVGAAVILGIAHEDAARLSNGS